MNNNNPIALVTGAASGMGRIYARRLAANGYSVAIVDLNEQGLEETADSSAGVFFPYTCDISSALEVEALIANVESELGGIEYAVHCAALMPARTVLHETHESLKKLTDINYHGTSNMITSVVNRMVSRDKGKIVIFGSVAGDAIVPNMASYCATKAAVNTYTESLINELKIAGSKVTAHLVKPPAVNTPLVDQVLASETPGAIVSAKETGRLADPEKIVQQIDAAVARGKDIIYPGSARFLNLWHNLFPSLWWKTVGSFEK